MRIYVISDDKHHSIVLSNLISNSNNRATISESKGSDNEQFVDELLDNLDEFDVSMLVSKKPIEASIEANKTDKLKAAVCKDLSDAENAAKAGVNVIILDGNRFTKSYAGEVLRGWLSSGGEEAIDAETEPEEQHTGVKKIGSGIFKSISMNRKHTKKESEHEYEDEEDEEKEHKPKKGIIKNIKYMFGLE